MKYSLWCKIFGHKFWARDADVCVDGRWYTKHSPRGYCVNCGLTKEELGITRPNT